MTATKIRVYELSKLLDLSNKEVIDLLQSQFQLEIKSHSSSVDQAVADKLVAAVKGKTEAVKPTPAAKPVAAAESPQASRAADSAVKTPVKNPTTPISPQKSVAAQPPEQKAAPAQKPAPQSPTQAQSPSPAQKPAPQAPIQAQSPSPAQKPAPHAPTQAQSPSPAQKPAPQSPSRNSQSSMSSPAVSGKQSPAPVEEEAEIKTVRLDDSITIRDLAILLDVRETEIIKCVFMKGVMVTVNQTVDTAFARSIAKEFGFEIEEKAADSKSTEEYSTTATFEKKKLDETQFDHLLERSPVVSIMGHVDHGKTSLLDAIRQTRHKIVDGEAGGITQSIGAYTVEKDGNRIVFLDTPGHEAFTAMRMRGAKSTDIAILVVAADDGVMPQTIEAINHAKAAQIPIIVAVNKIDKADADPDKVLVQLSEHGLVAEKWGGETLTVEVSALQKLGLEDVLETIILVSELLNLKADKTVPAEGVIIEARLDKRKGPVATALVQNGTLSVGENVLIGSVGGRVRALLNDSGERVNSAGPSTPVEILGLSEVPNAGDIFTVIRDEKVFKQRLNEERLKDREQRMTNRSIIPGISAPTDRMGIEDEQKEFNIIVKADTQGSAEAVTDALIALSTDEIQIKIIHSGTGNITDADLMLGSASKALVIGFGIKEDVAIAQAAENYGLKIKIYDIIYRMTEEVEKMMLGELSPERSEVEVGQAEVRQIFTAGKSVIAGCMVQKGKMLRGAKAVVSRAGKEVFSGDLSQLKRFKDDAKEVASGYECGISFDKFNDIQVGDLITVFTVEETERTSFNVNRTPVNSSNQN